MKPFFEQVSISETSSIKVKTYVLERLHVPLHYHPEHEIVLVMKGRGELLVGDARTSFSEGEVFLIGSGLPHLFSHDRNDAEGKAKVVVIQFRENLYSSLSLLPEFRRTAYLLQRMGLGIKITGLGRFTTLFIGLSQAKGIEKFNLLNYLLHLMAEKGNCTTIRSGIPCRDQRGPALRMQELLHFLEENHGRTISIEEAAGVVHLGKSSFCRYIKKETGKTFSGLLNEIRINAACNLLMFGELSATQVCYRAGFNNPGHFFRQFKLLKGVSPNAYRHQYAEA